MDIQQHLKSIENAIKDAEFRYAQNLLTSYHKQEYRRLIKRANSYVTNMAHKEYNWDRTNERTELLSYRWAQSYSLLKSRVLELKAVLAFAEDEPVKAKEFLILASPLLPKDEYLISGIGRTMRITSPGYEEWQKTKNILVYIIAAVILIAIIKFMSTVDTSVEEPVDYCDRAICK